MPENWRFRTAVLEKTLESPLDGKEIKPVSAKGNQPWIFIGRTDAEAEAPVLGHLIWRTDSLKKTLMLGKIESRRRSGWRRMRMVGCYHWLNRHEYEQTPRDNERQGSLVCCSPWGRKESDTTEWLINKCFWRQLWWYLFKILNVCVLWPNIFTSGCLSCRQTPTNA